MSSPSLELRFNRDCPPLLLETRWTHPGLHTLDGRQEPERIYRAGASYASKCLRALPLFFAKVRLQFLSNPGHAEYRFFDTPEQSLVNGLRKLNDSSEAWKTEIFGYDAGRQPLLASILHHGTSRRLGFVQLLLAQLPPQNIHIFWEPFGDISNHRDQLEQLIHQLSRTWLKRSLPEFLRGLGGFAAPPSPPSVLLERCDLLAEVRNTLASTPVVPIFLTGVPGSGKSELARQICTQLLDPRHPLLWVNWNPGFSLGVLASHLRHHCRTIDQPDADLEEFCRSLARIRNNSPEQAHELATLLTQHHVHVVLDNLDLRAQQSQGLSAFVSTYCARTTQGRLLLTTRRLDNFELDSRGKTLSVPTLSREQSEEYLRRNFPDRIHLLTATDYTALHEHSLGNFLRMPPLIGHLKTCLDRLPASRRWRNFFTPVEFPLNELCPQARRLLEQAVIFRSTSAISFAALERLARHLLPPDADLNIESLIIEMINLGLLTVQQCPTPEDRFYGIADSVRQMVERFPMQDRRRPCNLRQTHRWLAEYYQQLGTIPTNLIEAYYHWVMAGESQRGYALLIRNEKFLFDLDYTTALEECRSLALPPLPDRASTSLRAADFLLRGRMHYYHGRYSDSLAEYNEAIQLIDQGLSALALPRETRADLASPPLQRECGLRKLLVPALEQRGLVHRKLEQFDLAREDFRRCLAAARCDKLPVWQAHALSDLGMMAREQGRSRRAERYFRLALRVRQTALCRLKRRGRLPKSPFWSEELAHIQLSDLYVLLAICALDRHAIAEAQHQLDQAELELELAGTSGTDNYYRGRYLSARAFILAQTNSWDEALAAAHDAYDFPRRRNNQASAIAGQHCLGVIFLLRWQKRGSAPDAEALPWLEQALIHLEQCHHTLSRLPDGTGQSLKFARVYGALALAYQERQESRRLGKRSPRAPACNNQSVSDRYAWMARDCARRAAVPLDTINPLAPWV